MFLLALYGFIFIFIVVYCVLSYTVKIKIGKPPIDILFIAYKYSSLTYRNNFQFLRNTAFSRKTHKLINFFYFEPKSNHIEYAQGVILSENGFFPENSFFSEAKKSGLNFFTTPPISHAIFLEFPIIFCFPLTKLFAVIIGYPSIRRFTKLNNLCAYPVIEIYSMKSVTIVVPLVQQDGFVVHEAENIIFGKSYTSLLGYCRPTMPKSFLKHSSNSECSLKDLKVPKLCKRIMKG